MEAALHDTARLPHRADERETSGEARWRELVAQIGVEVAAPLTSALERVHALTRTGQIDRAGLRALRDEVERARASGMIGQQLARFASGRLRQSHERLQLAESLQAALAQRETELAARGLQLKPLLRPVDVIVDPALLSSLMNTLLDWALVHAQSGLELRIDAGALAQLSVRFVHGDAERLDSLAWRLLQQTAWTMGLQIERSDAPAAVLLTIAFPRAVNHSLDGVTAIEFDHRASVQPHSLAGNHVLVAVARRDLAAEVCDTVRRMGLIVDVVGSIEEAAQFCHDGLPHALVFDSALRGEAFDRLRADVDGEAPEFVFIEIADEGNPFEISGFSASGMARVGRDAIDSALPSALMIELSKGL